MATVIVLGGSGIVGSYAVRTLAESDVFSRVLIGDIDMARAEALATELGDKVEPIRVDLMDPSAIETSIAGCDVVLNCSGPFYKLVKGILEVVIKSGIHYVDVCDDVDVTLEIMAALDGPAKEKGVKALIGMGSSPGVTNLLGKFACESLLDEAEAVDIFHAHGGEPVEGAGVIGHRFHCMSIDIPMFLDGELKYVKYFEPDGIALRETFTFPLLGEVPLYPYPHPEQVTMPKFLKLQQVTNKGSVLPNAYYELIRDIAALGLHSKQAIEVNGHSITPYDFSIAYILRERERILEQAAFGTQRGCVTVIARGKKNGKARQYRFHLASADKALGEGTGMPAAIGAIMMQEGMVDGTGVMPPEACVSPLQFLSLAGETMQASSSFKHGENPIVIEEVDENGTVTPLNIG
ncbi:MAG: saccharopine dehydrogenase NADP-binding domain-containing protein [Myxococcota bacterium]|nr:saccharopine dehydrogenase NADP-binding domain-containing protein [Myxococcota bacterium]